MVHIRSSHRRCSVKKDVFRNFAKFTGKHLCQSLFFNKVAGLKPETLLKKRLWHRCFPTKFCEISKNILFTGHLGTTPSVIWKLLLMEIRFQIDRKLFQLEHIFQKSLLEYSYYFEHWCKRPWKLLLIQR